MEKNTLIEDHSTFSNPPAGALIWFIMGLELLTFIAGIYFFMSYRANHFLEFKEMQMHLNLKFAIMNTLFLVTSGYFVAMSVNYLKELNRNKSRSFLLLGIVFGLAFLVLKSFEYSEKISQGYTSSFNAFFTFYWFLTFFHFMHVLFVTGILTFLFFKLKKESEGEVYALEVGGALWHMCDLIWILLFPTLFYIR